MNTFENPSQIIPQQEAPTDFTKLSATLREMYSEEEIAKTIHQVTVDYETAMEKLHIRLNEDKEKSTIYEKKIPKFIERVLANKQVSPEIRAVLENLQNEKAPLEDETSSSALS